MNGYMGSVVRVDLTSRSTTVEPLQQELIQSYIGGSGLASAIFYQEVSPETDPLGPDNKLVFALGPLTGTPAPMSGRHVVVAKSPLTGLWGEADAGGFWGYELKRTGIDVLIVEGRSSSPVYLWIANDGVEIRPADNLWGMDTVKTDLTLKSELGKRVRVASIGPAGENLVKLATIMNDGGRTAGRGGLGAVWGAKKLKAIALKGDQAVAVADPDRLKSLRREMLADLRNAAGAESLGAYGTGSHLDAMLEIGNLPLRNWAGDEWDPASARAISSDTVSGKSVRRTKAGCYGCPIGCEKVVAAVADGPFAIEEGPGPEYETIAAFGSLLLNDNWDAIVKANDLCNRYGIDTIGTGTTIAMATESFEQGLISEREVGFSLGWGDPESLIKLVDMIGSRRGFGDVLAEGARGAAEQIGGRAPEFAMQVKGSSICMHDPRIRPEMGLKYATLPMGAYHGKGCPMESSVEPEAVKVAETVVSRQNFAEVVDSLIMCQFAFGAWAGGLSHSYVPQLLAAVTGLDWDLDELDLVGERIFNLKRAFGSRLGLDRRDDVLPQRFVEVPRQRGGQAHTADVVDAALPVYYRLRGWDENGKPTADRLEALEIPPAAE